MNAPFGHEILRRHEIGDRRRGEYFAVRPDLYLLPEYALALLHKAFGEVGEPIVEKERLLIVADHFAPPATIERAGILKLVQSIVADRGWQESFRYLEGISHQLLLEDARVRPGMLIIGADSHTVTGGALGAWACGFGSHDLLYALCRDQIWVKLLPTIAVRVHGRSFPSWTTGKDLALKLFAILGPDGFHNRDLELFDITEEGIALYDRIPVSNMVVDGGAQCGLWPHQRWIESLAKGYDEVVDIDLDDLEPQIASPSSPFNVQPAKEAVGQRLDQAFLGSCNAGRLEDFRIAADLCRNRHVAPGIRAIAIPGSKTVYLEALRKGYIETLVEAGWVIGNPSCGPCGAIDKGILGDGDRCIATMNRNFRGRMGSPEAEIWLAGTPVVTASALMGRIALPEEII